MERNMLLLWKHRPKGSGQSSLFMEVGWKQRSLRTARGADVQAVEMSSTHCLSRSGLRVLITNRCL